MSVSNPAVAAEAPAARVRHWRTWLLVLVIASPVVFALVTENIWEDFFITYRSSLNLLSNSAFDVVSMPRTTRGGNWTISWQTVRQDALWEASDIVADIQAAYDLIAA